MRSQMRALLRAAAGRELKVMIPMVTETREIYGSRNHRP